MYTYTYRHTCNIVVSLLVGDVILLIKLQFFLAWSDLGVAWLSWSLMPTQHRVAYNLELELQGELQVGTSSEVPLVQVVIGRRYDPPYELWGGHLHLIYVYACENPVFKVEGIFTFFRWILSTLYVAKFLLEGIF